MGRIIAFLWLIAPLAAQEQKANIQTGWPCTGKERAFDPVYAHTAEASGGQVFLFDRSETEGFTVYALNESRHGATIARAAGNLQNYVDIRVPVDPSIESLFISATLQCMQRIVFWDPQSSEALPAQTGGEDHLFRAGRIAVLPKPQPGIWTVRLLGSGYYSVSVRAKTGRGLDVSIQDEAVTASVHPESAVRFLLAGPAGERLQELNLTSDGSGYSGAIPAGSRQFRVMIEGIDEQGFPFQRMDPRLFDPALLKSGSRK